MKIKPKWKMKIKSSNFKVNTIKFKFHLLENQQPPVFQLKTNFYRLPYNFLNILHDLKF